MSTSTTSAPPGTEDPPPARAAPRRGTRVSARTGWRRALRRDWQLYSLAILPLLFFLVFRYLPMIGNVIAFRRFEPGGSIFGEEWVGLRYVRMFLSDPTFWQVFRNTLWMGGLTLVFCFPIPIVLALLLNEVRRLLPKAVRAVGVVPSALPVDRDRRGHHDADAGQRRSRQPRPRLAGPRTDPFHPGTRVVPHHLRRLGDLADHAAGARSSTSPPSPRSTRTCTRRRASTVPTAGSRSGTSPCPASGPPWSRC